MLKDIFVILTIIYGLYLTSSCECRRNNVCRKLNDYRTIQQNPNCWYNPDIGASQEKIAKRHGYPFESYKITTQDGYILSLFRIPHNGSDVNRKRPPIFLQHGLGTDSATWMLLGLESSVFVFANNGYDVWMSNSRGTQYSSGHSKYTVQNPQYWNFSFHEMAIYDVPAMIDFIAAKTDQKGQITYIGHSMGTTISYIYASLKHKHAVNNLKSVISLAPVAYADHIGGLPKATAPFSNQIRNFFSYISLYGIGLNFQFEFELIRHVCSKDPFILVCVNFFRLVVEGNEDQLLPSGLPALFSSFPAGVSAKTVIHYTQIINAKKRFQFFDYGTKINLKLYNSLIPPEYPLSQVKVPVHLLYGKKDILTPEKDVYNLFNKLETDKTLTEVFSFTHCSFFLGRQTNKLHQIILQYLGKK